MNARAPLTGGRRRRSGSSRGRLLRRLTATLTTTALFLGLAGLLAPGASAATPCADLSVTGFVVQPTQPVAGQRATVTVEVRNAGSCVAQGFVTQWRQTPFGPAGPSSPAVDLGPGQSVSLDLSYTFPKAGNFETTVVVDTGRDVNETNEANNLQIVPVTVVPATVDLAVAGVTLDPERPVRGRLATATVVVTNSGNTASKAFTVAWRPAPGAAPVARQVDGLGAGDSATVELQHTYLQVGTFDATVTVDSTGRVAETDERNNTLRLKVVVEPPLPDLRVTDVALDPAQPVPGQVVTATITVANTGNTASAGFRTQWRPTPTAPALSVEVPGLAAGESTSVTLQYTFPRAGAFTGSVTVDPQRRVRELDETNNVLPVAVAVSPNAIDLEITSIALGRGGSATQGEPTTANLTVRNNGNTASGPFLVDWNPDATYVISPSDQTVTDQVDDLGPGQSTVVSFTFSYPKAGNFSTLGTVDPRKQVAETNEANNQRVLPVTVGAGDIDLVVTAFAVAPSQPIRFNPATATITVQNTGSFPSGPFAVQWKLRAADTSGPSVAVRDGLNPGESRTVTLRGTYFKLGETTTTATVDPADRVPEPGGEGNNVATRSVTVVPPSATLQVSLDGMRSFADGDSGLAGTGEWDTILFAVLDPASSCTVLGQTIKGFACRTFGDDDVDDNSGVDLPGDRSITVTLTGSAPLVMATAVLENDSPLAPQFLGFATAVAPSPGYLTFGTKGVDGQKGDCSSAPKCFRADFKVVVKGTVPPSLRAGARTGATGAALTVKQKRALKQLQAGVRRASAKS